MSVEVKEPTNKWNKEQKNRRVNNKKNKRKKKEKKKMKKKIIIRKNEARKHVFDG